MKILVTGGTGLIGSNLTRKLQDEEHNVLITGSDVTLRAPWFKGKCLYPSFIGLNWDDIGKVDILFHQAAINETTLLDKTEMFRANVESSKKLFEHAIKQGCKRIVYASSTAIYGNEPAPYIEGITKLTPLNPYAESKIALERTAHELNKNHLDVIFVGLRYCNIYGPGERFKGKRASMILQIAKQMKTGNPKLFKYGEQKRAYQYVEDTIQANILAAKAKQSCIVNCGTDKPTSFNEIVKILNKVLGLQRAPEYIDNPIKDRYQTFIQCDMTQAKEKIGFIPHIDIETGIKKYHNSGELLAN
ncbi:MAG: NAD-dependent epimerase/dehydratase family protein [Nanoarchaeota archaeon]